MTEIKWLIEMLMNNKLSPSVKDKFIARIGEVEESLSRFQQPYPKPLPQSPHQQSPSTQRILDEMAQEQQNGSLQTVAQTPVAAQALAARQSAITLASQGLTEPGRISPRKF